MSLATHFRHLKCNSQDRSICNFYNPYFGNGCKNGTSCKFRHLKAHNFIGFCTRMNKENKASAETRNTFRCAIDLLKKGKADKAIPKFQVRVTIKTLLAFLLCLK